MFQFDEGLVEDEVAKQTVVDMRLKSGQTTINQENQDSKFPLQAWGDEPLLPDNMLPLSMIVEAHESSLEQADQAMMSGGIQDDIAVDGHEHQKKMDKESIKQKEERALNEVLGLTRAIKGELERRAS